MKQVYRKVLSLSVAWVVALCCHAQVNIAQLEYFFDNDPGFGNATQVTVATPASNIVNLAFNANVTTLSNGMHTLFIRSKDANGQWSITNAVSIAKIQPVFGNPNVVGNIVQAEYFYDNDPGMGFGTNIPLTAATNIMSMTFSADVSALSNGMHTLFIRTRDASGKWSITNNLSFAKVQLPSGNPNSLSNIVKAEYFYDTDPGHGMATNIPVTSATNITSLVVNADVSSLATGMHTMYVRTMDATGKWSVSNNIVFAKVQPPLGNPNTAAVVNKMEYFYNTDPGFGNGVDVPVTAAGNISGLVFNADVTTLPSGFHTLYLRSRDAQGRWSITHSFQFSRIQGLSTNPHTITNIDKVEYFYDSDPGYGNGTNISITPGTNLSGLVFNADVSALSGGMHTLYVRSSDGHGQWSIANALSFAKVQGLATNPNTLANVDKIEYYYDNDPGYGNGTDIPVVTSNNISSLVFNADVSSLSGGMHTLYVRARDAQGKWSVVNNIVFAKVQGLLSNPHTLTNVTSIEYFVDTDPGFGNGIAVAVTPALDLSNVVFNVDMTVLVNAPHNLYVRTKDASGKWSITNTHSFVGGTAPLAVRLLSFDALVEKDNTVKLKWVTAHEKDVSSYLIERSSDASNWNYVGEKTPLTSNYAGRREYELVDLEPGSGVVYYRLSETDLKGKTTYAPIRFVKLGSDEQAYTRVYPNPSDGRVVNISSDMFADGEVVITIVSADGKLCLQQIVNDQSKIVHTLSGLNLADGSYFLNIRGKKRSESLKLNIVGGQP